MMVKKFIDAVCYICGYDEFSADDVKNVQAERTINDHEYDRINYAVCPGCGFTVEV